MSPIKLAQLLEALGLKDKLLHTDIRKLAIALEQDRQADIERTYEYAIRAATDSDRSNMPTAEEWYKYRFVDGF